MRNRRHPLVRLGRTVRRLVVPDFAARSRCREWRLYISQCPTLFVRVSCSVVLFALWFLSFHPFFSSLSYSLDNYTTLLSISSVFYSGLLNFFLFPGTLLTSSECLPAPDAGYGLESSHRWSFSVSISACVSFIYNGYGGNRNNFLSRSDCETACMDGFISFSYLCFFFGVIWVLKPSSPKCTLKLAKQEYKSTLTTSIGIRIMFLWLAAGLSKSIDIDW